MFFPVTRLIGLVHKVEHEKDIIFREIEARHKTQKLKLDLYKSKNANDLMPRRSAFGAPVFLYVHGGGWVTGHKNFHSIPLLYSIARSGWLVVTVNYRLSPWVKFPTHLLDLKRAIAWVRENIDTYGGDPNFIVVGGESAGGHLASLVSLTPNNLYFQPGFETVDTSTKGCINLYGKLDMSDRLGHTSRLDTFQGFPPFLHHWVFGVSQSQHPGVYEQASPVHQLERLEPSRIPPFFTAHGTHDLLIPVEEAREFHEVLKKRREELKRMEAVGGVSAVGGESPSIDDVYVEVPGASHAFNNIFSPRTFALNDSVCAFLNALVRAEDAGKKYNDVKPIKEWWKANGKSPPTSSTESASALPAVCSSCSSSSSSDSVVPSLFSPVQLRALRSSL